MRVLFLTGSTARYMAPPKLSDQQINAGPDWTDAQDAQGRWTSVQTPAGEYSVASVFAKLPMEQWPDVLVCLVDSSRRNLPRNLSAFNGPKVLLVADTHHLQAPLMTMLRYAGSEPFDRVVFLYDRHHAPLFAAAGFRNLFWFPGLTFPHADTFAASTARPTRMPHVAFVGQTGKHHPRRARLLAALTAARVPVAQRQVSQADGLRVYGSSLVGFNASLNGDLNLRFFEILAAGALALTDELAPGSGLQLLRDQGCGFATYRDEAELIERARHCLAHPDETRAAAAAGREWFQRRFNETERRKMFAALALDGRAPEIFPLPASELTALHFSGVQNLLGSTMVYEGVQELHRTQETVHVALTPSVPTAFAALCGTLPRVELTTADASPAADLLVTGVAELVESPAPTAARVWCHDASEDQLADLHVVMNAAGLASASNELAVYCRAESSAQTPAAAPVAEPPKPRSATEQAAAARAHFQRGEYNEALELGRAALQAEPKNVAALTLLADLALLKQGGPLAEKLLRQARELAPKDGAISAALAEALLAQRKDTEAEKLAQAALRATPNETRALRVLARLCELRGDFAGAAVVLEKAAAVLPDSAEIAAHLGLTLRRSGGVRAGLNWQRRALGVRDEIPPIDPATRRVRVAFVAQHPQGWTSLESVWRELAADPRFETRILAAPYEHPYPPEGGPEAIYDFLRRQGVPFARWDERPLERDFADLVFVQNPYDVTRPSALRTPNLLRLVPRLAYVPYGIEIGGGETNAANQFNLPLQQHAWLVCARSPRHRAMFEAHCASGAAHVAVTGHPRLDTLAELPQLPPDAEFTAFARGRKIVFWNPQFDIRPDDTGYSTFLRWEKFLLEEFARRQDLAFVIRPHPLFFGTLQARRIWSAAQVEDFLSRAARAGNVLIDRRSSYLPIFAASCAMLSDASTFLLEYAGTGKPLLYLHNPRGPSLNADGEFIREHNYTAEAAEDIFAFLDRVSRGEDPKAARRRETYPEVMHRPAQGVAAAVRDEILARLRAEARELAHCRADAAAEGDLPPSRLPDEAVALAGPPSLS